MKLMKENEDQKVPYPLTLNASCTVHCVSKGDNLAFTVPMRVSLRKNPLKQGQTKIIFANHCHVNF